MRRSHARRWAPMSSSWAAPSADRRRLGPHEVLLGHEVLGRKAAITLSAKRSGQPWRLERAKATSSSLDASPRDSAVGQASSSRGSVGAPRSAPPISRAAGKVAMRSARRRLSSRRSSLDARSSSRAIARSSPATSPWGMRGRSRSKRSRAMRQAMRASSASSFFLAGPRLRATRSGFTGTTQ